MTIDGLPVDIAFTEIIERRRPSVGVVMQPLTHIRIQVLPAH